MLWRLDLRKLYSDFLILIEFLEKIMDQTDVRTPGGRKDSEIALEMYNRMTSQEPWP